MIMPIVDVVPKRRVSKVSIWVGRMRATSLSATRDAGGLENPKATTFCGEMLDPEQQPLILAR